MLITGIVAFVIVECLLFWLFWPEIKYYSEIERKLKELKGEKK